MADDYEYKRRETIKFVVWTVVSVALVWYICYEYYSGRMISWYYYEAATAGYAVDVNQFKDATKEKPARLEIVQAAEIQGLQAVPVKKGDRLPKNTNGVISKKDVEEGKRVALEGNTLKVMVPVQIKEAKGFKYRDTYKHKGIKTNPWSGVWNVAVILALGFSLGMMAEGVTGMMGLKLKKIKHFEGAH